jgi:hypothetical protein
MLEDLLHGLLVGSLKFVKFEAVLVLSLLDLFKLSPTFEVFVPPQLLDNIGVI